MILLPAAFFFWRLGADMPKPIERFVASSTDDIAALDPANQHKVDQLLLAAAEIRGDGIARDFEELEAFNRRRRQIAAILAGFN